VPCQAERQDVADLYIVLGSARTSRAHQTHGTVSVSWSPALPVGRAPTTSMPIHLSDLATSTRPPVPKLCVEDRFARGRAAPSRNTSSRWPAHSWDLHI